jgi:hypothetical protein
MKIIEKGDLNQPKKSPKENTGLAELVTFWGSSHIIQGYMAIRKIPHKQLMLKEICLI